MSDNVHWLDGVRKNVHDSLANELSEPDGDLAGGGGPPHDPGMEARVSAIESAVIEIKGSLGRIEVILGKVDERVRKCELDLAELKGRVGQLPTTVTLIGLVIAVLALTGVLGYLKSPFPPPTDAPPRSLPLR